MRILERSDLLVMLAVAARLSQVKRIQPRGEHACEMNFLVVAQLPRHLACRLRDVGHDALQTHDLPTGNRTPDATINALSARAYRVVVTKDADLVNSFLLARQPYNCCSS
jgi:hypothetical protein